MASIHRTRSGREVDYPTSDGKPMAETDLHRDLMFDLIGTLKDHFVDDPRVYVSGNLLLFYEEGNRRRHVSPDVFVVFGVEKKYRDNYLLWQEGKGPDFVIEVTSKTTRREDQTKKRDLYREVLKIPEYFQFDPTEDYLKPPFQGHRLVEGEYVPIEPVDGRLPSAVLNLHLERDGTQLRLVNPATGRRLPTPGERVAEAEAHAAEAEAHAAEAAAQATAAAAQATAAETRAAEVEAENERLRREMEELRKRLAGPGD